MAGGFILRFFFFSPRRMNYSAHMRVFVLRWIARIVVCACAWVLSEEPGKVAGEGLQGRTTSRTNFATEERSGAPALFSFLLMNLVSDVQL